MVNGRRAGGTRSCVGCCCSGSWEKPDWRGVVFLRMDFGCLGGEVDILAGALGLLNLMKQVAILVDWVGVLIIF